MLRCGGGREEDSGESEGKGWLLWALVLTFHFPNCTDAVVTSLKRKVKAPQSSRQPGGSIEATENYRALVKATQAVLHEACRHYVDMGRFSLL